MGSRRNTENIQKAKGNGVLAKIAVAMSVYHSDSLEFLKISVNSLLNQQNVDCAVFIMVDGVVSNDLTNYLNKLACSPNVFIDFFNENKGLAFRLNQVIEKIIQHGEFDYIARMDADDISEKNRFQEQANFLSLNEEVDIVGSDVIEIDCDENQLFYKNMDATHQVMEEKIIKKCPFNHPSVMFRFTVFSESPLRYKSTLTNTQDYYLWVDALKLNFKFANINQPLLKFRIDENFHKRRGLKKAYNDIRARYYALNVLNCYSAKNVLYVALLAVLRLSPSPVKKFAYNFMRRFI